MMRFSRLADFAVVLMTHVAQGHGKVLSAAEIAAATRLPAPTVASRPTLPGGPARLGSRRQGRIHATASGGSDFRRRHCQCGSTVPLRLCSASSQDRPAARSSPCAHRGWGCRRSMWPKALEDVSLADIAMPVPAIRAPAQPLSSGYPSATKADQHRGSP